LVELRSSYWYRNELDSFEPENIFYQYQHIWRFGMSNTAGTGAVLVVGGGISGLTAALEAAEVGNDVFIIDKNPYFGGRVAQLNQYFPKLCPPTCGLEINFSALRTTARSGPIP
jgi:hypothetical protein